MLKKLSILIVATLVVGFCGAVIPAESDAGAINCSGWHKHKKETGTAFCRGQMFNQTAKSRFTTSNRGRYSTTLGRLRDDYYTVRVAGGCIASAVKYDVRVSIITTYVTLNY